MLLVTVELGGSYIWFDGMSKATGCETRFMQLLSDWLEGHLRSFAVHGPVVWNSLPHDLR